MLKMKKFLSVLGASWFIILVVIAQHRGFYVTMILSFSAAIALILQDERYKKIAGRNPRTLVVSLLACASIVAFVWQANTR